MAEFSNDTLLFIGQLRADPKFRLVLREVKKLRPVIPIYKPQETRDLEAQLLETIKYGTASQAGFDLLYLFLTGERND